MIASNSGPRCRTRIRTSPARSGWRSSPSPTRSPRLSQVFTASAIWLASLTRGLVSEVVSNGSSHASTSFLGSGTDQGHSSTSPGEAARTASCWVGAGSAVSPLCAAGCLKTTSTASSTTGTDRKEWMDLTGLNSSPAALCARSKELLRFVELQRFGALEREDRLLVVADREDRAFDVAPRAGAREELGDESS